MIGGQVNQSCKLKPQLRSTIITILSLEGLASYLSCMDKQGSLWKRIFANRMCLVLQDQDFLFPWENQFNFSYCIVCSKLKTDLIVNQSIFKFELGLWIELLPLFIDNISCQYCKYLVLDISIYQLYNFKTGHSLMLKLINPRWFSTLKVPI